MKNAIPMVDVWRGALVESQHQGHAVICDAGGNIVEAWGDPRTVILPRSSAKMLQALPLVESGAADRFGLQQTHLALACASHSGAPMHTDLVTSWLSELGLSDADLRCGPQAPMGEAAHHDLLREGITPCQIHNNCSGKHSGFLTLAQDMNAGPEYIDPDHPVQLACRTVFEEVTGEESPGFGIDGCAAPNFMSTLHGMARAMGYFAAARDDGTARERAAMRLWQAMYAHPQLVAGEGRACTRLMQACTEPVALKTGAEGFFIAILPTRKLGIALKIADGTTRAAECVIAALLVRLGVLETEHPATKTFYSPPVKNWRGDVVGRISPVLGVF